MSRKIIIPIALLSIVIGVAFAARWVSQYQRVERLTIATGRKGGDYYTLAETLARVISQHQPQIQIEVVETTGSLENTELLDQKKVDLALVQNDVPTSPSLRSIALLYSELFHLIASDSSAIKTVSDIKGKRLALPPKGSGSYLSFELLLSHYDLTTNDFQHVELSAQQAAEAFRQGQVDAIFRSVALGNNEVKKLLQATRGQLVPIDQAAAMKISKPYLEEATIPKGTYRGTPAIPDTDLPTVGVPSSLLTHKDVSDEIIREITQILFENRNDLVNENILAGTIKYPAEGRNLSLPMHPGAAAYYDREKPSFLQENTELIGLILSICTLIFSWIWSLQRRLLDKQKNRADKYNLEILHLIEKAHSIEDIEKLELLRQKVFEIFTKVLEDLDRDTLSPESYQLFIFPCEVALTTIRHREQLLLSYRRKTEEMNN